MATHLELVFINLDVITVLAHHHFKETKETLLPLIINPHQKETDERLDKKNNLKIGLFISLLFS